MKFRNLVRGMTLLERRALHENVKSKILREAEAASDASAPAAAAASAPVGSTGADDELETAPVGSSLTKDGKEIYRKTQQGWKITMRASIPQILQLVRPDTRNFVEKELSKLNQGEEFEIMKGSLIDPGIAGDKNEIVFQRDGDLFADPGVVDIASLTAAKGSLDLVLVKAGDNVQTVTGSGKYAIGDAVVTISNDKITISVASDGRGDFRGFEDIFGKEAGMPEKINSAIKKTNKSDEEIRVLTFKLSDASSKSLIGLLTNNIFSGLGIGKIRFVKKEGENKYVAEIESEKRSAEASKILKKMAVKGTAKSLPQS